MKLLCAGKSLYKPKPVGVACVCVRERERERERDARGLKTSQQRTDYFNKDCAVLSRSVIQLFATPWTIAPPPPRLLCPCGFFRQEYWSGLSFPSLGDHPNLGIELRSPASQADCLPSEPRISRKAFSVLSSRVPRFLLVQRGWQ